MASRSFDQECVEMTPIDDDKKLSASFQLNSRDSFGTFAGQDFKLRIQNSEQAESNKNKKIMEFIPSEKPLDHGNPSLSPLDQETSESDSPVVLHFEPPKLANFDRSHKFSFITQNQKIQEHSARLNLMNSAQLQEDRQSQEQEYQEDSRQLASSFAAHEKRQISDIEVMEMTKQFNSLIDVYRPRIDRICNFKKIKVLESEKGRVKKDVVKEVEEEQFANSYSMASIIESQLEKQRKFKDRFTDSVKQDGEDSQGDKTDDVEKVENRIWVETKILSFHSTKFHVKVHGKLCTNYTQRSFSRFSLLSNIRQIAIWINEWVWFERAILLVIIINAILFGAKDYSYVATDTSEQPLINAICDKTVIVVAIIYVSEMLIKLLALGLLNDKQTYLRDWWNLFDLLMVIASIFSLYPEFVNLSIIRTFKIYRFFMLQQKFKTMRNLIKTLVKSLPQLFHLSVLLIVCQLFYATVGLQIWSGQTHYRCRQTLQPVDGDWKVVENDLRVCGGLHQCNETLSQACGSLLDPSIRLDLNLTDDELYRDSTYQNLNYGLTNFDNVINSYITVFQTSTLEGWMQILQFSIDGDNQIIASIYFIALVIVIHFLILNMSIGVMIVNCQELHVQENLQLSQQIEECGHLIKERQAELQITDFEEKKGNKCTFYCGKAMNMLLTHKASPEPIDKRYDFLFFRLMWRFVHQPSLRIFFYLLAVLNLVMISIQTTNLQFDELPAEEPFSYYYEILLAINFFFFLEFCFKLLAFSCKTYFTNSVTVVDLLVTLTYFVVFAIDCVSNGKFNFGGSEFKWTNRLVFLNCLRTIKIFELLRINSKFKIIIETIKSTLKETPNYMIIMFIFIYVFALLGLQAFAGKLTDSSTGTGTPRMNFDNLLWALLSVVQVLMGEKWNLLFYDCYKGKGLVITIFYFFPLVTIGVTVMMNLFLVLLLGNYQKQLLITQLQNEQSKLLKVGGSFKIDSKVPTLNPILIGDEEINGLYGYGEGLPSQVFDGVDSPSQKLNSPFRSILKTKPNSLDQSEENERMSDPPSSHRNLIKLERMSVGSPNFNIRSRQKNYSDVHREPKNEQYDSSLEMEDYIQKYEDFKKKEREDILKKIRDHIGQKDSEVSPLQRSNVLLPFAEALQADKFYQLREPQTALLRPRLESTLFENQQDKQNLSARNDDNKAGQRRVEIIGGNLFVQDSQSKLGQIAQIISKGVASLKISKVAPEGHKSNLSAKPKSKGVYQQLCQNFSWSALRQFLSDSSLFILHKNSSLRQLLIRIAVGGEKVRTFKSIPDLLQFYSQDAFELRKNFLLQNQHNLNPNQEEQNSEGLIENLFHHTDSADIPSTALNNSQAISELQQLQSDKRFSFAKIEEQAVLINKILEQKKHKSFYINPSLKQKGVFYLDEKRDINIQWNKWYHFTIYQFGFFIVQLCVIIAILVLILDDPLDDPNSYKKIVLRCVDLAVTLVFIIEALIKILALGFFKTSLRGGKQRAYLQNFWNVLDFAVLLTTIFQIQYEHAYYYNLIVPNHVSEDDMTTMKDVSVLRIIRALRILRPLRVSSHLLGLKLAMNTIISSTIQILNVTIISFFGLVLFAILGKSLFNQCFYQCLINGDSQLARTDFTINTRQDCLDQGYEWKNAQNNFDDMPSALWTLFTLFTSTSSGWLDAMYNGIDARGFELQPKHNNNPWLCMYFVCFMIVSQMLMFNLFVGIVFEKYSRFSDRITSFQNANNQQRAWIDVQRQLMRKNLHKKLFASQNACRVLAGKVSKNKYFGIFVMTCIVLNSVVLAIPYLGMSIQFSEILNSIVIGFTVVYNIEAAIKIIGLGRHYFYSRWNQFDFIIVLLADLTYLLEKLLVNISLSKFVVVMRALRALRVIRVLKEHRQAMISVNAVMAIIGFFLNILIILFLILLIFSVLGMDLYKSVMLQDQYNESYNFRSFGSSFLLLIGCLTGQNWNVFMKELSLQDEYNGVQCVQNQTYEDWQANGVIGCGSSNAYFFFFFYITITRFLIVNLMTGFVIYGFISANRENQGIIKPEDIDLFIKLWADYDHNATGWIEVVDVVFLIYELPAPLGKADDYKEQQQQSFAFLEDEKRVSNVLPNKTRFVVKKEKNMVLPVKITIQEMNNLNVKVYNDPNGGVKCHFKDICIALMTRALNKAGNPKHQAEFEKVTSAAFQSHFGNLQENAVIKNETAGSYLAGIFLGRLIKGVFQRKHRHRENQMPSIGVYNAKAEYSRKLRELEIKRAQQKRENEDNEQKRLRESSISKFETETALINRTPRTPMLVHEEKALDQPLSPLQKKVKFQKDFSPSIYPVSQFKKSLINDSNFFNQGQKQKDTERSSWWLPETHIESTTAKIQNWIAQQDFCHGHHDQSDASDNSRVPKQQNQDINENNDEEHKNSWDQSVYVEEFNEISTKQVNLEVPPMRNRQNADMGEQRQLQHYGKQDLEAGEDAIFIKQSTLFKTKILLNKVQPAQIEKIEEIKEGSDTNSFITDSSISYY